VATQARIGSKRTPSCFSGQRESVTFLFGILGSSKVR